VRAIKFIGDGKDITNLSLPVIDWEGFGCNIIPDVTCLREIGSLNKRFREIYTSNINLSGGISAAHYIGSGNQLTFDNLSTSILPATSQITLGNPVQYFDNVFARRLTAIGDVEANKFVGDGSMLTNIKTNEKLAFSNLNSHIVPASNNTYNIGHPNVRFANMYGYNIHALQSLAGARLALTRPDTVFQFPYDDWQVGINPTPESSSNTPIPADVVEQLGGLIDMSLKSAVVDVLIVGELYGYKSTLFTPIISPLLSNLSPKIPHHIDIGAPNFPFREGFFDTLYIGNNIVCNGNLDVQDNILCSELKATSTCEFDTDIYVDGTIHTNNLIVNGNIQTSGSILSYIPKVGPLTSNVTPFQDNTIDLGSLFNAFRTICSKEIIGIDVVRARKLEVENDLTLGGDMLLNGKIKTRGHELVGTKSGYCVPLHAVFASVGTLLYSSQTVSFFIDIEVSTGVFTCNSPGLYNVSSYGWRTTRGINDMDISWRLQITNIYNNSKTLLYLKGCDSRNFVLGIDDSFVVQVFPGYEPDATYAPPLTIFQFGAIVVTQVSQLDSFIQAA
jgi:hypothetical protein